MYTRPTLNGFPRHLALPIAGLLLTLTACDGGGESIARPEDLRLSIIRGRQQTGQVKPAGAPQNVAPGAMALAVAPGEILAEPVVVRVSVVGGGASVGGSGIAGPSFTSIPAGAIVNWRVIGEGCGTPFAAVTALGQSDSVVNYWRLGTKAGTECKMVAEGIAADGQPFDSDTARATFTAGAASRTYDTGLSHIAPFPRLIEANAVQDAYGNPIPFRVEGDANVSVAGGEVGSVEGRTVTFIGTPDQSTTQRFILRLLDSTGAHVGNVLVLVHGSGTSSWWAAGLDVPLS